MGLKMNSKELDVLLEAIHHELFWAEFETFDEVCYGSVKSVREAAEKRDGFKRIYKAIPENVWDEWLAMKRKEEADKLRKKADMIERGEDIDD